MPTVVRCRSSAGPTSSRAVKRRPNESREDGIDLSNGKKVEMFVTFIKYSTSTPMRSIVRFHA